MLGRLADKRMCDRSIRQTFSPVHRMPWLHSRHSTQGMGRKGHQLHNRKGRQERHHGGQQETGTASVCCLRVCLPACISVSACVSVCLSAWLSARLWGCPQPPAQLPIRLPAGLSFYLLVCLNKWEVRRRSPYQTHFNVAHHIWYQKDGCEMTGHATHLSTCLRRTRGWHSKPPEHRGDECHRAPPSEMG